MTEVIVAAISGLTALGVAIIGGLVSLRGKLAELDKSIGTPNGHGNVTAMLEKILSGQTGQDVRLAKLEHGQAAMRSDISDLTERVSDLETGNG